MLKAWVATWNKKAPPSTMGNAAISRTSPVATGPKPRRNCRKDVVILSHRTTCSPNILSRNGNRNAALFKLTDIGGRNLYR